MGAACEPEECGCEADERPESGRGIEVNVPPKPTPGAPPVGPPGPMLSRGTLDDEEEDGTSGSKTTRRDEPNAGKRKDAAGEGDNGAECRGCGCG